MIVRADVAREIAKQKVVNVLMKSHAAPVFSRDVPVFDGLDRRDELAFNTGFFPHLAERRLFRTLASINKPLWELPAPLIGDTNKRDLKRAVTPPEYHAARGDLLSRR